MMPAHRALIPIDGSPLSRQIVPQVLALLDPGVTQLVLLRIGEPVKGVLGAPPRPVALGWLAPLYDSRQDAVQATHPIYEIQIEDGERALLENTLTHERRTLESAGFQVTVEVRFGNPAQEIVACAHEQHVDLIAMATHGRSGVRHLLLGSVAEQVLRNIRIPVLLLRPFVSEALDL